MFVLPTAIYAAIAYSLSTGAVGISQGQISQQDAYHSAMEQCGEDDCFVRASVKDGCIAFAHDDSWQFVGFDGSEDILSAEAGALLECQRPWPTSCKVVLAFCAQP